jgi:diadenosine tetraphosphate (Ap4A) HIT family hydrolase
MDECLFCKIVKGNIPSRIIWEDNAHLAFLTPYPNTPGFTVVIPKIHHNSYCFSLDIVVYTDLMLAAKEVGLLLDARLGTQRTGLILEGMGVDHAHVKLFPMHGISQGEWKPIKSNNPTFFNHYEGYISSHDCHFMTDENIEHVYRRILGTSNPFETI